MEATTTCIQLLSTAFLFQSTRLARCKRSNNRYQSLTQTLVQQTSMRIRVKAFSNLKYHPKCLDDWFLCEVHYSYANASQISYAHRQFTISLSLMHSPLRHRPPFACLTTGAALIDRVLLCDLQLLLGDLELGLQALDVDNRHLHCARLTCTRS